MAYFRGQPVSFWEGIFVSFWEGIFHQTGQGKSFKDTLLLLGLDLVGDFFTDSTMVNHRLGEVFGTFFQTHQANFRL